MYYDMIEKNGFDVPKYDTLSKMQSLNSGFETKLTPTNGYYYKVHDGMNNNIANWLGINVAQNIDDLYPSVHDTVKKMYSGSLVDGKYTLGLKEISQWKINPDYAAQNIKQQAGFAAEVISTAKENLIAKQNGTGVTTVRLDDLADKKNDPYVDKIRQYADGSTERVQTKFVGKNGKECLSKLMSKDYEKYLFDGKVDKIEIPQDFYDEIRNTNLIEAKISNLEEQISKVTAEGKNDVASAKQMQIDKLKKIDQMLDRSTVTMQEAIDARIQPKRVTAKLFAQETIKPAHEVGIKSGLVAAGLTMTISAVDNVTAFIDGEITAKEMVEDITKDTVMAGALGYGTEFITTTVSHTMARSSSTLIKTVGGSCLPAAVVSFAVESYDSVSDFAQGNITGSELAYDLGENAAAVAGGIKGATIGATIGSVAGPVGTVAGGIVGGVVGTVVASEVYATAVEVGAEGVEFVAEKAQLLAKETVDLFENNIPDKLDDVKNAFNNFFSDNKLPFSV